MTIANRARNIGSAAVRATFGAARSVFSTVAAGAMAVVCPVKTVVTNALAMGLSAGLTLPLVADLVGFGLEFTGTDSTEFDGDRVGRDCKKITGPTGPGVMPKRCGVRPSGELKKTTYINGINTSREEICKSLQEIANATCTEVTGVYNATQGMGRDIKECMDNLARSSESKAVDEVRQQILKAVRSNQELTLFAHSQGGLITQEAIAQAKAQLTRRMGREAAEKALSKISVKSFGTAALGWPVGPSYERFTNLDDPIPPVILAAQSNYPKALGDSAGAQAHHVFYQPHLNPIESHSMDSVYVPQFKAIKGPSACLCLAA